MAAAFPQKPAKNEVSGNSMLPSRENRRVRVLITFGKGFIAANCMSHVSRARHVYESSRIHLSGASFREASAESLSRR